MKTLFVILPCYNEQENIKILLDKWLEQKLQLAKKGYNLKIISIDDKSTDCTKDIIQKLTSDHREIIPLLHQKNQGLGGAISTGLIFFALHSSDEDIALIMDADNTHDPIYVYSMIKEIEEGFDCVIASRYCSKSKVTGLSQYRNILTICAKFYYQILLGIPKIKDYTCGYRAYRSNIIKKAYQVFDGMLVTERSFACMMELLYKLHIINAKIAEVPFELRYDLKKGKSKMNVFRTIKASVITAIKLRISGSKAIKNYEGNINAIFEQNI